MFLVLSGVGGLLEEELVEGDAALEGKQSLVSTPRISSQVPFFEIHVLIFKRYPIKVVEGQVITSMSPFILINKRHQVVSEIMRASFTYLFWSNLQCIEDM